ncbi:EF hand [Methylomagnum ishizawai]|uniref:EF hand n=1 Tax=Methylomagnum ishizawai TaxID=1760988 RepID=A0A1Y6D7B6_9GAMM|nr:hypothetical protein [Methylomagnum ishizawai]SMF96683.1 EF hand [Methylomagnum ishizawai]
MTLRRPLTIALLLAASGGSALAKSNNQWPASYDTDGNGKVSKAEIEAARTAEFTAIDTDGDGYATLAELQTWLVAQQTSKYDTLNTDGGTLSQAEFVGDLTGQALSAATETFTLADTDGDSGLSADEFKALRPVFPQSIQTFVMLDTDRDTKISQDEYLTPPKPGKGGKGGPGGPGGAGGPGGPGF